MFLGLDLGTTNVKALVTDLAGRALAKASCPIELHRLANGGVEQDIEQIWRATVSVLKQVGAASKAGEIQAVGVSSQGGAMQLMDCKGHPVGRVISWLDQRGQADAERFTRERGSEWLLAHIGHRRAWLAIGQLLRIEREAPGFLLKARVRFVGDLVVERLCGRAAQDGTSAGLTLLYNPGRRIYDPELLDRLGLKPDRLPDLLSPRSAAGPLREEVAAATGLPAGMPVSAAVHDQYASALAAGVVEPGMVMVGTGTAWVLLAVNDHLPKPVIESSLVCHHVIDGLYGQILSLVNGGSALTWAMELLGLATASPDKLERLLEAAPPGSDGLSFWPFLTPFGATGLAPDSRGRVSGLQLSHRPAHLLRAVVESLAFELKRHLLMLAESGNSARRLVLTGGAAGGSVTPQILADVTGLPLICTHPDAGSVLGAAMLSRGLAEPGRKLSELASAMAPPTRELRPGPDREFYAEAFERYHHNLPLAREGPLPPS